MQASTQALDLCLNEFFGAHTSNSRKRVIEQMLENFSNQPESWKHAVAFLSDSANLSEYLQMYCLSVIERKIKVQWNNLTTQEQHELNTTMYSLLIKHSSLNSAQKYPAFIRNKMIKLLSDIGKFGWPESQPDVFNNGIVLSHSEETVMIGLQFLKTISEEWTNAGDECSTQRKQELKRNLTVEVPKIFQVLEGVLNAGLQHRQTFRDTSNNHIDEVISLALDTTIHYFSWISLDGTLTNILANSTLEKKVPFSLQFVQMLCQYSIYDFNVPNQIQESYLKQGTLALGALNELGYRKYVPKEFEKHMNTIVHFGIELLNKILHRDNSTSVPEQYMEKILEFLCLITGSHFNQFSEESAKAFLSLLLPFTFSSYQTDVEFYYACLDIWNRLLEHLNAQLVIETQLTNRDGFVETYKQPILALANSIVHCTIKYKISSLDIENDAFEEAGEDDVETLSLQKNIEVLVKIGEFLPSESLESLVSTWRDSCQFFATLQSALDPSTKTTMQISSTVEIEHFQFIVQVIGRMANIFYGDVFKQELTMGTTFYKELLGVYNFSRNFYFVRSPDIVVAMNREIVYSMSSWTFWLVRFHTEVILGESTLEDQHMFFEVLGILTEVAFFAIEHQSQIESSVALANANFFLNLVTSVRTQFVFQIRSTQSLIENIHLLKNSTSPQMFRILNKSVSALLLLPWQSIAQQEWESRTIQYNTYMKKLLENFFSSSNDPDSIVFYIQILGDQLELITAENINPKKMCWNVIKEIVPYLQKLATTYLRHPKTSEFILSFFSKIMETLRQQAGATFFESTIQGFLGLFSSENIIVDLLRETESSSVVIEKFLMMLQCMVKDPSPAFKKFIGDVLSICFDHIYPILAQRSTPDLKVPFFSLIRDILNYRWNYFFPTLVLHPQNTLVSQKIASSQSNTNQDQQIGRRLDDILQSIGHSFLQQDLDVFRYNLATLTSWNEKHNFYAKLPREVNSQFMTVLLQVLVHKTHDLHREEMARVLHGMASTDYVYFRTTFLHDFLQQGFPSVLVEQANALSLKFVIGSGSNSGGYSSRDENRQQTAVDLPTFSIVLTNFIDNLRHYHFLTECQRINTLNTSVEQGK